jgi:imidazolonepropionase
MLAIINCKQIVTLAGPARSRVGPEMRELSIINDGAVLVLDDRIERVGTRHEIEPLIGGDYKVVDAGGRVVLPGFVDAHTHPVLPAPAPMNLKKERVGPHIRVAARRRHQINSRENPRSRH